MSIRVLRQFLYRDDGLVRDFLAQIEGGTSTAEKMTRTARRRTGAKGRVGVPFADLGGELGSDTEEVTERNVEQTAASDFQRL